MAGPVTSPLVVGQGRRANVVAAVAGVAPVVGPPEVVVGPEAGKVGDAVAGPVPEADGSEGAVAATGSPSTDPSGLPSAHGGGQTVPAEVAGVPDGGRASVAPATGQVLGRPRDEAVAARVPSRARDVVAGVAGTTGKATPTAPSASAEGAGLP